MIIAILAAQSSTAGVAADATPDIRTIIVPKVGAASIPNGMDPQETQDYVFDLTALLETDEAFDQVVFTVTPASVSLGLQIETNAPLAAAEFEDGKIRLWLTIIASKRDNKTWDGGGTQTAIEFTATTSLSRVFQRTCRIPVQQK